MHKQISKLILYKNMDENSIINNLRQIFSDFEHNKSSKDLLIDRIYTQVRRILELATDYGFNNNLWQNYLTFLLMTSENPFTYICEKTGALEGSVNIFAKNDFQVFMNLFHYDFKHIETVLNINCFTILSQYTAVEKKERMYNKNVSEKVSNLSLALSKSKDVEDFYRILTNFYKDFGVGMFGLNKAFRISNQNGLTFMPINNMENTYLSNLIGYQSQKQKLYDNTNAFVEGKLANNVLLFGDSGTGKSTCIKAIVNEFYDKGLRMIEVYKHQFHDLSNIISMIKNRNYKFIIYMDDLSFEEFEIEYKYLKAVIEGGMETKPDNVLIYATSNRRHLIKETWNDKSDMVHGELHRSDTVEEKLSLVKRFGVTIFFSKPSQKEYYNIVLNLAKNHNEITLSEEELCAEANKWELSHGGLSGRSATQFIHYMAGKTKTE